MAAVKAPVKHAAKVRAQPVHRATALLHHAETGHRAGKAHRALKVKAMAAVKVVETVAAMAVVARNNVAIPVLTTVAMAKAVPHREVPVLRAVAPTVVVKAVAKSVASTMATSCHATSTP